MTGIARMLKKTRIFRCALAAGMIVASLGAVAVSAAPAQAASPNAWRLVYRSHTQGEMTGVVATGPASGAPARGSQRDSFGLLLPRGHRPRPAALTPCQRG